MPPLPPGQRETPDFPRFGLTPFATRFPSQTESIHLHISGDIATAPDVGAQLAQLQRVTQTSDFHCVTTWTRRRLRWSGFRFADFYEQIVVPLCPPDPASGQPARDARFVVLRAQDGARTSLPLEDLLGAMKPICAAAVAQHGHRTLAKFRCKPNEALVDILGRLDAPSP